MEQFFGNIRHAFRSEQDLGDNAGFIDEILFIVGIALAAVAISSWIGGAAMNKGADVAACIEGQNITAGSAATNCNSQNHAAKKGAGLKEDVSYKKRFG